MTLTDPGETIRKIHEMGAGFGFERTRVDRSQFGGTPERPAVWFEVGYGCAEIKVRTSDPTLTYRSDADRVNYQVIENLLAQLRGSVA